MSTRTIKKFRWFWAWQDEQEEAWLEWMSTQGFHLQSIGLPGFYEFEAGQPRHFVYRLDFTTTRGEEFESYLQPFDDTGWEYLGAMSSWRYFRTEPQEGEQPEIFTDKDSKLKKYYRVMVLLIIFLPVYSLLMTSLINAELEIYRVF